MDISDGLSSDVLHLCKQAELGCRIYEEKIPINEASKAAAFKFGLDPTVCALNGGEDYELLMTISQEDFPKIKGNPNLSVIGHVTHKKEGVHLITRGDEKIPLIARGWNSLESEN